MSYFPNPLTDYSPQLETGGRVEPSGRAPNTVWFRQGAETVFSEEEELDLASEFLEIHSERDLENYLGALIDRASRATNARLDEPVGRDHIFKKLSKMILPMADPLGVFGGGRPRAPGSGLAAGIGPALGLELEGLSPEDSDFEIAKQFVRFAGSAIRNAQETGPTGDPAKQAHDAAARAAQLHAPGLMDIHGGHSVDRPAERPDRSSGPTPSPRPNGERIMESYERGQFGPYRDNGRAGRSLSEDEQTNLAAQLMEVTSEEEFENFLGDLFSKGLQAVGKFISSPTGQALSGVLKDAAKTLLPIAGTATPISADPSGRRSAELSAPPPATCSRPKPKPRSRSGKPRTSSSASPSTPSTTPPMRQPTPTRTTSLTKRSPRQCDSTRHLLRGQTGMTELRCTMEDTGNMRAAGFAMGARSSFMGWGRPCRSRVSPRGCWSRRREGCSRALLWSSHWSSSVRWFQLRRCSLRRSWP